MSELYGKEGEVTFEKRSVERVFGKDGITEMTIPIVEDEKKFANLLENNVPNFIEGGGVVLVHNYGMIVWGKLEEAKKWLEGIEYLMNYHVKLLMIKGAKSSVI